MKVIFCVFAILASSFADFEIDWANVVPGDIDIVSQDEASFNIWNWLNNNNRVVGGQEVEPNSLPYQAALITKSVIFSYFCGGSLISQKYVLTAAHCIDKARQVQVILGAHKLKNEPSQKRFISKQFLHHPKYNKWTVQNDIGLVELPKPVELTKNIQIIPLPSFSEASKDFAGELALMSGWGSMKNINGQQSDVLRSLEAEVIKNSICKRDFGSIITDKIICTSGEGNIGGCSGDSGGPLVANGKQIGIASFVHSDGCDKGHPTAFTRITSHLDWINKNSDAEIKA